MRRWTKIGAAAIGAAAVGGVAAVAIGNARWNRETARTVARLTEREGEEHPGSFSLDRLAGLPAPVARYFELALAPGAPIITRAQVQHAGEFASRPGRWAPFTSVQSFTTRPPGFVWEASIRLAPKLPAPTVRVRDSYLDGEGAMHGAAAGLVTVVDQRGTSEMASSSLARFLAEIVWLPTALLPGDAGAGVAWSPIDDRTARATLTDRGNTATVDFHFDARGAIVAASGERFRDVSGTPVLTKWEGHFRDYTRVHGMLVPMAGDVAWLTPEGPLPYWRARITRIEYWPRR